MEWDTGQLTALGDAAGRKVVQSVSRLALNVLMRLVKRSPNWRWGAAPGGDLSPALPNEPSQPYQQFIIRLF